MARHDLEKLTIAAGLVGRGKSYAATGAALEVNERTVRRWAKLPTFQAEVARVRADLAPTAHGVFVQALTARKDDGIDWQARIRAAEHLLNREAQGSPVEGVDAALDLGWT